MNKKTLSKGQKTRQSLIRAAQALFSKQGYAETSVDQIVESIHLTIGVFYSNFKSKEDLLKIVLKNQIEYSKEVLLTQREDESSFDWLQRALSIYLSPQHRDSVENSCPLTTMSQELIKLGLDHKSGLNRYLKDFEEALRLRLNFINPGRGQLAPAIISMCVGALQTSRMQKNKELSNQYLLDTKKVALELILQPTANKA